MYVRSWSNYKVTLLLIMILLWVFLCRNGQNFESLNDISLVYFSQTRGIHNFSLPVQAIPSVTKVKRGRGYATTFKFCFKKKEKFLLEYMFPRDICKDGAYMTPPLTRKSHKNSLKPIPN